MRTSGRTLLITLFLTLLTSIAASNIPPPSVNAITNQWSKYPGNPVLTGTPSGWDQWVWIPRLLYDGHMFKMWYYGSPPSVSLGSPGGNIGYANSTDGKSWTKQPTPVLTPGSVSDWDANSVSPGRVVWNGTQYLIWYTGNNGSARAFGLATSPDGITWTKYAGNPVMTRSPGALYFNYPYVIRVGGTYKMWYSQRLASDAGILVYYATSVDGIHWTKRTSPVFSSSLGSYSPTVAYMGGKYVMFYSEANGQYPYVNYAVSSDGISWTVGAGNPLVASGQQSDWDNADTDNQDALIVNDTVMLFYSAAHCTATDCYSNASNYDNYRIGLATPPAGWLLSTTGSSYLASILLIAGWNLISIPIVPINNAIASVISSLAPSEVNVIWGYVGTGLTRSWASYKPVGGGSLTTMSDGNGYWIYMQYPDTLFVAGNIIPPGSTPSTYSLVARWNLIGFKPQPTIQNETVSQYLESISSSYDPSNVWVYDNASRAWARANSSTWIVPGQAMWILVTSPSGATLRP